MIYAGLIHFNDAPDKIRKISSVLESYNPIPPIVVRKNSLTLYYGKFSNGHDMDEVWENVSSVLMGRIFVKEQEDSFRKEDFKNLSYINKEVILEKIWGKYIYLHSNQAASQFEIVVDTTGQLPFFYYPFPNGNILFSSDIEVILKILLHKPGYNWDYLSSYVVYGNSSAIQTPFKDIYELPPACCLKITKSKITTESFWNPLGSYKRTAPQKIDAVSALQETLKPWIDPYKNICVSLSGGLDSSSLVYCLKSIKREDQALSALNYFHSTIKSSNELIHARKVCQETGIKLIEIDASHSLPFDPPRKKRLLTPNKPFPGLVSLRWLENISDHVPSDSSCAFISGHGSDHIFMRSLPKKSVSDYLLEKGIKGSQEKLQNITQFYRDTFFSVFKENARGLVFHFFSWRLHKRDPKNNKKEIPDWFKLSSSQKDACDFIHPIYEHLSARVLPGKYEQIDALYEGLASIQVEIDQLNPTYYPFLYKPTVEFALSLPTYTLFEKGYDRYPLRRAVSDHFKTDTVWRRDKSHTTGLFQLGIKKNLDQILDMCLEGQLVKQGIIDREGLHKTIMLIGNGDIKNLWHFANIASVEIFLKLWEEQSF